MKQENMEHFEQQIEINYAVYLNNHQAHRLSTTNNITEGDVKASLY